MSKSEPIVIICPVSKIHKPKPRRLNKKTNIYQYNKKCNINKKQLKQKALKLNSHEYKKNNLRNYFHEEKKEKDSFNLDLISLEEIENDFKEFKSKNEEIEEQRELIQLIGIANEEYYKNDCIRNIHKIKRPLKPFCKNIEY